MNGIYTDTGGGGDIPLEKCGVQLLKTTHAKKNLRPYYKFGKLQHSTRIVKNQFNSKQIIDYFSTHSYIVDI